MSWRNLENGTTIVEKIALEPSRAWIIKELDQLHNSLQKISVTKDLPVVQKLYYQARLHYKHIEFFIEYISPREAKYYINGPLVPKHDPETGNSVFPPKGFQRIEEIIFSDQHKDEWSELLTEVRDLDKQFLLLKKYYSTLDINDGLLLEMPQLQLFRIASLNLNGYDATFTHTGIREIAWNLEGIRKIHNFYKPYCKNNKILLSYKQASNGIEKAMTYLKKNPDYNSFNRLEFIIKFINPINASLVKFHNLSGLPWNTNKKALYLESGYLFGRESFNVRYFSIYYDDTLNLGKQAELGKMLFFDPILSGNNKFSCAGCHDPDKSFTDGLIKSITFDGQGQTLRNAPTLINVIFQKAFFYDGRAYQLEQQISDVIHNPVEMHGNFSDIIVKLRNNKGYRELFSHAFEGTSDASITDYAIQKSLTEYEKTIVSFNSRFDNYLRGDNTVLNTRELNGYNVFAGKGLCGSCHFFPLFNGTVPPFFSDSEFEVIGTPENYANKNLDTDLGRYFVTGIEEHKHAFKTPTLRNIELTSPYMHNGAYKKLEEVIEFYHRGGGAGLGFNIPNQTLPFDSLHLTHTEKEDLVYFLNTLTDRGVMKK